MDCPGADIAFEIRNVQDLTPSEIAETNGHPELASTLRGYMNMNEFSHMYSKLKEMSLSKEEPLYNSYVTPKSIEQFYKICPAPRPVAIELNTSEGGYMTMNVPKNSKTKTIDNEIMCEDKFQKELLEIINDFKNNVHSIAQVEKLVEEWKNRNDVQKSYQEKQDQLNQMRMRYDKIQHDMKTEMKKPTPFDRVKKLFGRGRSREEKSDISGPIFNSPSIVGLKAQRPISSLSTSSSGSSGRMSTISGCSLGDSGTHSDNEERKVIIDTL